MSSIMSKMSSYAWSAEQAVVYVTLTVIGASLGLLEGTFKGFQKLQPNLTSREGLEDLLYGSNHRSDPDRHSIADLLASWIPMYKKKTQPAIQDSEPPKGKVGNAEYTNGIAPEAGEVQKAVPVATADKVPKQVEVDGHNIHNFYSDDSEMSSAKPSTPDIVSHRPITPSSTWDNASFSTQRDDISSTASYDRGASSDADISDAPASTIPGQEPKKKRKGLKKLGQKMKKAFVEPFEKMGSRSGSRPGSRHASPHKRA